MRSVEVLRKGRAWSCSTTRGEFTAVARVGDQVREGVVWAPSIWWAKLASDGTNANATTSQRETDMGGGPVLYDNLVEVALAD